MKQQPIFRVPGACPLNNTLQFFIVMNVTPFYEAYTQREIKNTLKVIGSFLRTGANIAEATYCSTVVKFISFIS